MDEPATLPLDGCDRQPPRWPLMTPPPGIHVLVGSPPLEGGLNLVTGLDSNTVKVLGYHL